MQLSKRMQMIADMVVSSSCVADIGTDHGFIPIWLAENGVADRVIASDLREGPLARAREHIQQCGAQGKITLRLGDGLKVLSPGEADCIILSGMGGLLMIQILSESPDILAADPVLILQPQSDIKQVRRFLHENGWRIEAEDMVIDEKFYTVMRAVRGEDCVYLPEDYVFGRELIEKHHPVLLSYLYHMKKRLRSLYRDLVQQDTDKCRTRLQEIREKMDLTDAAIARAERRG